MVTSEELDQLMEGKLPLRDGGDEETPDFLGNTIQREMGLRERTRLS